MKLVSQIAFNCIFIVGLFVGVGLGLWLCGVSWKLVTDILGWFFPQYVILHPIDYAGPLPNVASIIVLGFAGLIFIASLRKFDNWFRANFSNARKASLSGRLIFGLPSIFALTSLFGLHIGYFAWSIAAAALTFIPGI